MDYLAQHPEYLVSAGLFVTTAVVVVALCRLVAPGESAAARRLRAGGNGGAAAAPGREGALLPAIGRLGEAAARPFLPKDPGNESRLRKRLAMAGLYAPKAMQWFVAAKVGLMAGLGALGFLVGQQAGGLAAVALPYLGAVVGYVVPSVWLSRRVAGRRRALELGLPDALDLMVVCVESGLTLDAAMQRVGEEIAEAHPEIGQELGITHMETRVGVTRAEAMRNLGQRTGAASLKSLSSMLVQAERFGTGIAQALRVHSEMLRVKRQYAAEEAAVKTTVKLAFPVVLFIFPTLMAVLGAPAVILFLSSPAFNNQ